MTITTLDGSAGTPKPARAPLSDEDAELDALFARSVAKYVGMPLAEVPSSFRARRALIAAEDRRRAAERKRHGVVWVFEKTDMDGVLSGRQVRTR